MAVSNFHLLSPEEQEKAKVELGYGTTEDKNLEEVKGNKKK